jgi:hypothetical protein
MGKWRILKKRREEAPSKGITSPPQSKEEGGPCAHCFILFSTPSRLQCLFSLFFPMSNGRLPFSALAKNITGNV